MSHPLNKAGILLGWEKKGDACHKLYECGFYMHYFFLVSSNWVNAGNLLRNFYYPKKHRTHSFHCLIHHCFVHFTLPIKYLGFTSLCLFSLIQKEFNI